MKAASTKEVRVIRVQLLLQERSSSVETLNIILSLKILSEKHLFYSHLIWYLLLDKLWWHLVALPISGVLVLLACFKNPFPVLIGSFVRHQKGRGRWSFPSHPSQQTSPAVNQQAYKLMPGSVQSESEKFEGPEGLLFLSAHFKPSIFCLGVCVCSVQD